MIPSLTRILEKFDPKFPFFGKMGGIAMGLFFLCGTMSAQVHQVIPSFTLEEFKFPGFIPSTKVNCITEGPEGFIWMSSHDGLYRYDGQDFKVFQHIEGDSSSLGFNYLGYLFWDSQDRLWVGSHGGGLYLFNPLTEKFRAFPSKAGDRTSLSNSKVTAIVEDSLGNIWVGTAGGLNKLLDVEAGVFEQYFHDAEDESSILFDDVRALYVDRSGVLWIGSGGGIFDLYQGGLNKYVPETNTFKSYKGKQDDSRTIFPAAVRRILEDSRGNFWIATGLGLCKMDREKEVFERMQAGSDRPYAPGMAERKIPGTNSLMEDKNGGIWVGTAGTYTSPNHLLRYDPVYEKSEIIPYYGAAWYLFQSADGTIWMAGAGETSKIYIVKPSPIQYDLQVNNPFKAKIDQELPGFVPSPLHAIDAADHPKEFWAKFRLTSVEEKSGRPIPAVGRWNLENDATRIYILDNVRIGRKQEGHMALGTQRDRKGRVWGTFGEFSEVGEPYGGFFSLDPKTGENKHFVHEPENLNSLTSNKISRLFVDSRGELWLGFNGMGLDRFNPQTGKFVHFPFLEDSTGALGGNTVFAITEDHAGHIWVGGEMNETGKGFLDKIDPQSNQIQHINVSPKVRADQFRNSSEQISHHAVLSMAHSPADQKVWFIAWRKGLVSLDPSSGDLRFYNQALGNFPDDQVQAIVCDWEGIIWASGKNGKLIRFDPRTGAFFSFYNKINSNFGRSEGAVGPNGKIYFNNKEGLYVIDPKDFKNAPSDITSNVRLVDFSLKREKLSPGQNPVLPKPIWQMEEIKLSYKDAIFAFHFSVQDYRDTDKNQYRFRLYPLEKEWRVIERVAEANYLKVPPGEYVFELQGANSQGIWDDETVKLNVFISPPWWQTTWAIALFILILAILVWQFIRWRTLNHRKSLEMERKINERLRAVDKIKDQFLANTSHELRTPLNGIIGLSESMIEEVETRNHKENLSLIISSGKRLSSLVNDILDFSKLQNHEIELKKKSLGLYPLVDVVLRINHPLTTSKDLVLENHVPDDFPALLADEDRLQQILYNLVGNAIKFTEKGFVRVGARIVDGNEGSEKFVEIYVQDSGIGIPQDKLNVIFEAFKQGDGSVSRQFSGTGLGLTISKNLVELHGGEMWASSAMGKGTTFFFTMPLSGMAQQKTENGKADIGNKSFRTPVFSSETSLQDVPPSLRQAEELHILVVDDEMINQQVIKNHLSGKGIRISKAMNGQEALKLLNSDQKFDLVLLDVMMPRMSGYEVCQKIREKFLPSELPVIMITAKNQSPDIVEGLKTGANDYITKPINKEEFLARIETHLNLYHINTVTNRFVPTEFIRTLGKNMLAEVKLGDQALLEVSVLFADIRGYTNLSEKMSPEDNFKFVNAYAGRLGPIVRAHKGFINQYLGDGIMSIFQNSAQDALDAAIEMQRVIHAYSEERISKNRIPIKIGIGIHSGPLIMGIIGDEKRTDPASISDTVNTTARLEGLTKYYGSSILLTGQCLAQVVDPEAYHFRFLGKVQVRGKESFVKVYECLDGEKDSQKKLKIQTLAIFEEALKAYFEQDFTLSISLFNKILNINPADTPAKVYREKAQQFFTNGPGDDWNGVVMMEKE